MFSKFTKKAEKAASQAKNAVSKAAPKQAKQQAKQVLKRAPAPATVAKQAFKKAPAPATVAKKAERATKGWLGDESGNTLDKWYGPSRALFLPTGLMDRSEVPDYLNGELPGDYGYDPLGLGANGNVERYRNAELIHARWAMLAAAGIIIPEGLEAAGAPIHGGTWFETGAEMLNGGTLDYFAVPFGVAHNPLPLFAVVAVEVGLMGAVEVYRRNGSGPGGYSPGVGKFDSSVFDGMDNLYPGGPFDPLRLSADPEIFQELKVKEIKNGRLAMVSVLAFAVQGYVTGEGPYANWSKHVADPFGYNLLTVLTGEDRIPSL